MDIQTKCSNNCGACIHKTVCSYEAPIANKEEKKPMINFEEHFGDFGSDLRLVKNHRAEIDKSTLLRLAEGKKIPENLAREEARETAAILKKHGLEIEDPELLELLEK